jgi:hypothetical protein
MKFLENEAGRGQKRADRRTPIGYTNKKSPKPLHHSKISLPLQTKQNFMYSVCAPIFPVSSPAFFSLSMKGAFTLQRPFIRSAPFFLQGRLIVWEPSSDEIRTFPNDFVPVRNEIAPMRNEIAPARNDFAPVRNRIAPARNEIAPAQNRIAPAQNEIAPVQNEIAPVQNLPTQTATILYSIE